MMCVGLLLTNRASRSLVVRGFALAVVSVTLIVNVIKLFDLIYVMTAGGPGASSRVIAFSMYQEAFPQGQFGYGATIAIVMLLLLIPVMIFNIRRFRADAVQQ